MDAFARFFASDPQRHEGVRPLQIWGLRLFFLLMLLFVAPRGVERTAAARRPLGRRPRRRILRLGDLSHAGAVRPDPSVALAAVDPL